MHSRRHFNAALVSFAFSGLFQSTNADAAKPGTIFGYGPLQLDPERLLDLPLNFSYSVLSKVGQTMDDGYRVPDRADGMGCIALSPDRYALIRNHEMAPSHLKAQPWAGNGQGPERAFDRNAKGMALPGGTTTMIINAKSGRVEEQYLSLAGTIRNCAGGVTPWGSWLSCEEDVSRKSSKLRQDHGWVFEVPAKHKGLVEPVPLKGLGRFNHEAAAIDPTTGIVYLTEDEKNGLFYRFIPESKGELIKGGRLQALAFFETDRKRDTRNWTETTITQGKPIAARWISLDDIENSDGLLRIRGHANGAVRFARGEGIHYGLGEIYFACTSGGQAKLGQMFRYRPSPREGQNDEHKTPGQIELMAESLGRDHFNYADNVVVAPNGHILFCEDQNEKNGPIENHIRGLMPDGRTYTIARLRTQSELAGICFSPDGKTLFVNVYQPGQSLAIKGPWNLIRA
jgi:uncharacterized protein